MWIGRLTALALAAAVALPGDAVGRARASPRLGVTVSLATLGPASRLEIRGGVLLFCDGRGGRRFDPRTGRGLREGRACPAEANPDSACGSAGPGVEVRGPLDRPDDILDLDGWSLTLKGRVHDCAVDGTSIAIVTGSQVVLVDTASRSNLTVSDRGGARIALGPGWIGWATERRVYLASRGPL